MNFYFYFYFYFLRSATFTIELITKIIILPSIIAYNNLLLRICCKSCKDTICKKAQTISFVERGFERLGLGHQAVGFSWCSYMVKFSLPLESFSWRWAGRFWFLAIFPSPRLNGLFFLLYQHAAILQRPRVGLTF